jgi:nucleoside-diphosphate kinase
MAIINMNRTLVIIKPDAIQRRLTAPILERFESAGFYVARVKIHQFGKPVFEAHYNHIKAKVADPRIFQNTINWMSSIPLWYIDLRGKDAARKVKIMTGPTDPSKAPKGTIRGDFGIDTKEQADKELRSIYNLLHTSDPKDADKELRLFFNGLYRSFVLVSNFLTFHTDTK